MIQRKAITALSVLLGFIIFRPLFAQQNTPFEIRWTMDSTLSGSSSVANFSASDARLNGGILLFNLTPYGSGGAVGLAAVTQRWPETFDESKFVEFSFSPTVGGYEYSLTAISFRLRRSGTGPKTVQIRSSKNGFSEPLNVYNLANEGTFYSFMLPINSTNIATGSSFRFYAFDATLTNNVSQGTLWFDEILVRGTTTNFILPVRYAYFKVEPLGRGAQLVWQTTWEQNAREFVVQRSADLREWGDIGRVAAVGESATYQTYVFVDEAPILGANYYRLRQVDQDERYAYSQVKDFIYRPDGPQLRVLGNPVSNSLIHVQMFGLDPAMLRLFTASGQPVPSDLVPIASDVWGLRPTSGLLTAGVYILHVAYGMQAISARVIVP